MVGINDDGKFQVFFTSFGYLSQLRGKTLDEAIQIARKAGFGASITDGDNKLVGTWCPIAGFRKW